MFKQWVFRHLLACGWALREELDPAMAGAKIEFDEMIVRSLPVNRVGLYYPAFAGDVCPLHPSDSGVNGGLRRHGRHTSFPRLRRDLEFYPFLFVILAHEQSDEGVELRRPVEDLNTLCHPAPPGKRADFLGLGGNHRPTYSRFCPRERPAHPRQELRILQISIETKLSQEFLFFSIRV